MTAPTLESHGFTLDFDRILSSPPHWTRVSQHILTWERDTHIRRFDRRYKAIHHILRAYGPMLRYELTLLAHYCPQVNSKKIASEMSQYVALAKKGEAIKVYTPAKFLDEFPPEETGVTFHRRGGYCIIDEYGSTFGKWRTADEAFYAHKTHYRHVPGWGNIPNKHLIP